MVGRTSVPHEKASLSFKVATVVTGLGLAALLLIGVSVFAHAPAAAKNAREAPAVGAISSQAVAHSTFPLSPSMEMVHYVTYATHSQGMFEELMNNPHGVRFEVLGWEEKWTGYMGKALAVLQYVRQLPPGEFVVVVDGFDTTVNRPPHDIVELFESYHTRFLASKDPRVVGSYITTKVFGTCGKDETANAGMWMARAGDAVTVLEFVYSQATNDDQRALNIACHLLPEGTVGVDSQNIIFKNCASTAPGRCQGGHIFTSYPASGGGGASNYVFRSMRAVREYGKYFTLEVGGCVLVLALLLLLPERVEETGPGV